MSAPVVHHQQNRCMRRFNDAGAVSQQQAATLDEIGTGDSPVLRYLQSRGVIVEAGIGRFYLDVEAEQRFRRSRLVFTVTVIAVALAILAVVALATGRT
ncbi:MAG: hypothetical protein NWS00_02330 [Opitutales bacterium]|nr:hypothetical protein [Opitutales bacterium]